MTEQHVIAKSLGGTYTKPVCRDCHHKVLNPQIDRAFHNMSRDASVSSQIIVGTTTAQLITGSVQCTPNGTPISFLPHVAIDNCLEINAHPKNFNQGGYPLKVDYSSGAFVLCGGSMSGWVYVVGVLENN